MWRVALTSELGARSPEPRAQSPTRHTERVGHTQAVPAEVKGVLRERSHHTWQGRQVWTASPSGRGRTTICLVSPFGKSCACERSNIYFWRTGVVCRSASEREGIIPPSSSLSRFNIGLFPTRFNIGLFHIRGRRNSRSSSGLLPVIIYTAGRQGVSKGGNLQRSA